MPIPIALLISALAAPPAMSLSWESHTDINGIAALCADTSGSVLCGAGGGGVFVFAVADTILRRRLTNIDGLPFIDAAAAATGPDDRAWIGTRGGGVCAVVLATGAVGPAIDRNAGLISDTVLALAYRRGAADRLFAGMAGGLSAIEPAGGGLVRNFYPQQGFPVDNGIQALALRGDTLWIGTNQRLAYAPVDSLEKPDAWVTAVLGCDVLSLHAADTLIVAGTATGAVRGNPGSAWPAFTGLAGPVRAAAMLGDSVFFATANGVKRYFAGSVDDRSAGLPSADVRTLALDWQQRLWAGTAAGLARNDGPAWAPFVFGGLGGNNCQAVAAGEGNLPWVAHPPNGVSRFRDGSWQAYTQATTGCPINQVRAVACDGLGDTWFCSGGNDAGSGVSRCTRDGIWRNYAAPGLPTNFVFAITAAGPDFLYFAHWGHPSLNDLVIRWNRRDSSWQTVWGPAYLMRPNCLAAGDDGSLWIGTHEMEIKGVHRLLPDGTRQNWTTANSALPGDLINAIALDRAGRPWVGTNSGGLARFDGATFLTVAPGVLPLKITSLATDRSGNAWIGTDRGLHLRSWEGRWSSFTRRDLGANGSRLLSDYVTGIAVAARDGNGEDVYVATTRGLNVIHCRSAVAADVQTTIAPNPWIPGKGSPLMLGRLPDRSTVRIYTVDGRLVATAGGPAAPAHQLYLRLGDGLPGDLPSGIYVVHIAAPGRPAATLRLAVLR